MPGAPLSDRLRAAREAAGLSVSEVARRARTSRAAIYACEPGETSPSLDTAQRVLAASGARTPRHLDHRHRPRHRPGTPTGSDRLRVSLETHHGETVRSPISGVC